MTKDQLSQLGKTLRAIADCLLLLDALIAAHTEKLDALTTQKRTDLAAPPKLAAGG